MAIIPRRNYAQAHLDEIHFLTGIDDWFAFLDRPDRLLYLMEISEHLPENKQSSSGFRLQESSSALPRELSAG